LLVYFCLVCIFFAQHVAKLFVINIAHPHYFTQCICVHIFDYVRAPDFLGVY